MPSFIKLIQLEIRGIVGELLKIAFCEDFVSWIYVWIFIESGNILKDVGFCIWQVIRVAFYVNRWLIISRKKLYHSVWNGVILERLIISHLVKKFSESYATRRSLPCSQESDHLSISWVILTQFTPCNLDSLISILIYFHSCLVLSTFNLHPHQNFVCIYIFPYIFAAPPPISFSLIGLPRIFVQDKSWCSSLCIILQTPFIYCLLPPVFLCTLFANILSLRSSLNDKSKFTPL